MPTLLEYLRRARELPLGDRPGLVVEGGGLRGVYSIAALSVLEDFELHDSFSLVVGSSAGALNGAYFLARQATEGIRIYVDDLSNRNFVDPRRLWKMVDIDYLIDPVLKRKHPLDVATLLASQTPLLTVLTDASTAQPHVVSTHRSDLDIYEVFRATAALPTLYNKRVELDGRKYVDGGLVNQVPLDEAIRRGCKRAVVVLTRDVGFRRISRGAGYRILGMTAARGQSLAVRAKIGAADEVYNLTMDMIANERRDLPRRTFTVWPSESRYLVSGTDASKERMQECAYMAVRDMRRLLETEMPSDSLAKS